jgi:organic radical activating enzyme
MSESRDYYCNYKFKFLRIDLESRITYNCHSANPHKIDFDWLEKNPGQLFNNEIDVSERRMMLVNERNPSCAQNCWAAEDRGGVSPRLFQGGPARTHFDVITQPEQIDLTLNSNCNLTCSYCCKENSSSWRRDVVTQGTYDLPHPIDDRYQVNVKDMVRLQVSAPEFESTDRYQTVLNEVKSSAPGLKKLIITGGEPFLYNGLADFLGEVESNSSAVIEVYTGLGVNTRRFEKIISELRQRTKNVNIIVSGENIGARLEFNRYGMTWQDFQDRVTILNNTYNKAVFQTTLTNLTLPGFVDFYQHYCDHEIRHGFAYQPLMMACHVLDPDTKHQIDQDCNKLPAELAGQIRQAIKPEPSQEQIDNLRAFVLEFVKRRSDLKLDIFPMSFLTWLGITNVVQ